MNAPIPKGATAPAVNPDRLPAEVRASIEAQAPGELVEFTDELAAPVVAKVQAENAAKRQRRGIRLKTDEPAPAPFDLAEAIAQGAEITTRAGELEADSDLQADLERLAEYEHQQEPVELACFSPDEGKATDDGYSNETPLVEGGANGDALEGAADETARFPIALADTVTGPIIRRREVTWSELAKRLKSVEVGAKDGPLWLAGDHAPGPRSNEHVRSVSVLALDVEAKTARNPETGIKTVIGPEPPTLQEMAAEIELCGWRAILHTTHSHLDPGIQPPGVAHHRYRLVLALDRPLQPGELDVFGRHVASVLGISDCFDPSTLKPSQPLYLPRAPQERKIYFGHATVEGEPLPVESLLNAARAAQDALRAAAGKRQGPQTASVIDSFNAAHDVRELLSHHGYIPKRGNRWMHPESTTGMAGVRLLPESDPPRAFSSHGCCPLNDGHAHDAFSVWCILAHAGDTKAAVREAARLLGMEGERHTRQTTGERGEKGENPSGARAGAEAKAKEYPTPTPLPKLPPVPDLPLEILPNDLRGWVEDAAERARFRPDFAAVAAMSALGSVIGRQVGIRLKQKDDWTEYANVWGCVIGPPSALKSPAIQQALKPFKWLQVAADERHQAAMQGYKQDMEDFELRKNIAKKQAAKALTKDPLANVARDTTPPPEKPPERTYWTSNATAEALGVKLAENPVGLFLERDELSSLLVELEDERNATARGLYLSGWSGREGYRFDRIMRGTTYIPKFALSVFGGIQPGPLARYVRGASSGERADGLLQRFQLAVWPDPARFEYVDRHPSQAARERARLLFERADNLDAEAIGYRDQFGEDPPYVRLSLEAQGLFVEWYTDFMRHRRQVEAEGAESDPICAHFGKYPGLVGKLALILHIADDPDARAVSETTLLKALAWLDYLTPHARRIYHAVEHPETGAASLLLARVRRGELPEKFTARDIYRKGWHGLADSDAVLRACDLLQEYDWLIDVSPEWKGTGRPPAKLYAVSPAVEVAS